jgi:hypothetical protein
MANRQINFLINFVVSIGKSALTNKANVSYFFPHFRIKIFAKLTKLLGLAVEGNSHKMPVNLIF